MVQFLKNHPFYTRLFLFAILLNVFLHLDVIEKQYKPQQQTAVSSSQTDLCGLTKNIGNPTPEQSLFKLGFFQSGLNPTHQITALDYTADFALNILSKNQIHNAFDQYLKQLSPQNTSGLSPPALKV